MLPAICNQFGKAINGNQNTKSGEKPYECPKYERLLQRISETLKNYQINYLISQMKAFSLILICKNFLYRSNVDASKALMFYRLFFF